MEWLESVVHQFLPYGLNRLLLSGGEPTLHSHFDQVLALVDAYPDITFGIVTNGTNHHERLIEMLNTRDNLTLQISLDGSSEEKNAKTRGAGHFGATTAFARRIHNPHRKPLLKMVVSQYNLDDIEDYYKLALSLDCIPEYVFIYKSGNGTDQWENKALSAQQEIKVMRQIQWLNAVYGVEAFLPRCMSNCAYVVGLQKVSLCVKSDGSIQPCQAMYEDAYTVGNLYTLTIDSLIENLNRFSELTKKRSASDYSCGECLLREGCGKGCAAEAVHLHGDPLADDGGCVLRKLQFIEYDLRGKGALV